MFKRFSTNYMVILFLADGIVIQLALWVAMQLRFLLPLGHEVQQEWLNIFFYVPTWRFNIVIGILWLLSFLILSVYTPRMIIRWPDEFQRILLAHTIAALSLAGLLYLANLQLPRLTYFYFYLISITLLLGYRVVLRTWHRLYQHSSGSVAHILIVGAGKVGCEVVAEFHRQQWPGVTFVGFLDDDFQKQGKTLLGLPILGKVDQAPAIIQQCNIDEVLITLPPRAHDQLKTLVATLYAQPVRIRVAPDYFDLAFFGATVESLGNIPLIGLRDPAIDGLQRLAKRLLDIVLSSFALLLLSPLLAFVAIAIKREDGGPIFYRAERVGENGCLFKMLKFRSMVVNADRMQCQVNQQDANGHVLHKRLDDPRVTAIGRFIRRTSIDELPQLVNVLRGEMSLVGPRPELPWLVETYEPWQRKRFAVPQGITGWWQVNGRSDKLMHLHTDHDIYYIQNYSLWLDLQILWKTIPVVLWGKGAY